MLSKRFLNEAELIKKDFWAVANLKVAPKQRGRKPVGERRRVSGKERGKVDRTYKD